MAIFSGDRMGWCQENFQMHRTKLERDLIKPALEEQILMRYHSQPPHFRVPWALGLVTQLILASGIQERLDMCLCEDTSLVHCLPWSREKEFHWSRPSKDYVKYMEPCQGKWRLDKLTTRGPTDIGEDKQYSPPSLSGGELCYTALSWLLYPQGDHLDLGNISFSDIICLYFFN